MITTIEKIEQRAKSFRDGPHHKRIGPGCPFHFNSAHQPGEMVPQGDLYIKMVDEVPDGMVKIDNPTAADLKLVIGETTGASHRLDSFDGVTMYRAKDWNAESLVGPCLVVTKPRVIPHDTHGPVHLFPDRTYQLSYQRVWEVEEKKARRAAD